MSDKQKQRKKKRIKKEKPGKKTAEKKHDRKDKKALKEQLVEDRIIEHVWNLVTLWPKITDPVLENRVADFIVVAKPEEYWRMQQAIFDFMTPILKRDWRFVKIMKELDGKKVGLEVIGDYATTITLKDMRFHLEKGMKKGIPTLSVVSREDYRDAILKKKDPISMLLQRRIRVKGVLTVVKWALPFVKILRDPTLYERILAYQPEFEELLDGELTAMGH